VQENINGTQTAQTPGRVHLACESIVVG